MKPIEKLKSYELSVSLQPKINELIDAVNELMPKGFDCEQGRHDKCFSTTALMGYPAMTLWICRKCGKQGQDKMEYYNPYEYDELVKKFKEGE